MEKNLILGVKNMSTIVKKCPCCGKQSYYLVPDTELKIMVWICGEKNCNQEETAKGATYREGNQ